MNQPAALTGWRGASAQSVLIYIGVFIAAVGLVAWARARRRVYPT